MLIYTSWHDYTVRADRYWYEFIEGFIVRLASGSPGLARLDVFGHGWRGWNNGESGAENIWQRLKCCPDLIIIGGRIYTPRENDWRFEPLVPSPCRSRTHLMLVGGDCHSGHAQCRLMYSGVNGTTILATRHVQHIFEVLYPPPRGILLTHLPFCVPSPHAPPFASNHQGARLRTLRRIVSGRQGIVLFGNSEALKYPLRKKIASLVSRGLLPNGRVNHFPGYRIAVNITPSCAYDPMDPALANARRGQLELQTSMGAARICVFDSMIRRKLIRKFLLSWLYGCVPAADMPHDMPPHYRSAMIPLSTSLSQDELIRTLTSAYGDLTRLQIMVDLGIEIVARVYACDVQVAHVLSVLAHRRAADVSHGGVYLPYGFELTCGSVYPYAQDEPPLSWCKAKLGLRLAEQVPLHVQQDLPPVRPFPQSRSVPPSRHEHGQGNTRDGEDLKAVESGSDSCVCTACRLGRASAPLLYHMARDDGAGAQVLHMVYAAAYAAYRGWNYGGVVGKRPPSHGSDVIRAAVAVFGSRKLFTPTLRVEASHLVTVGESGRNSGANSSRIWKLLAEIAPSAEALAVLVRSDQPFSLPDATDDDDLDAMLSKPLLHALRASGACGLRHVPLVFSRGVPSVALHIRRGDGGNGRHSPTAYYIELLTFLRQQLPTMDVHAFSDETRPHELKVLRHHNVTLHLGGDVTFAWAHMASANIFVMAKSSFSFPPAWLNPRCVVYQVC